MTSPVASRRALLGSATTLALLLTAAALPAQAASPAKKPVQDTEQAYEGAPTPGKMGEQVITPGAPALSKPEFDRAV